MDAEDAVPEAENAEPDAAQRRTSRRGFLKLGGAAVAGAAVGGVGGAAIATSIAQRDERFEADPDFVPLAPRHQPGFDHIVVLMGENRSFDNLLGYLYSKDDLPAGETFAGLAFGEHANTAPDGTRVPAHVYSGPTDRIMSFPDPDPGEEYPHVNTQLFGTVDPPGNATVSAERMKAPYNAPKQAKKPTMDGFVTDYAHHLTQLGRGEAPSTEKVSHIMGSFSPDMLPVLSTLAREFAVFDHWYAGVPSQTFCNRSFFHASTSHGFVTNHFEGGYEKWLTADPAPTIFNRLEGAGKSWRIYFDKLQIVSFTGFIHAPVLEKFWKTDRFGTMEDFYADAKNGTLPAYAFIEPRMIYDHNDFHPPFGTLRESAVDGTTFVDSAESDVRAGDALVHDVYSAVRRSASAKGSNAVNTLLLITFDEHGGCYDHVPPPAATPPDDAGAGEMGFGFDRLGCRVPAIAVSAYTARNTIIHDEMHHGSVIATLNRLHGLEPLNARDAGANTLLSVVNLPKPRHPADWPETTAAFTPPNPEATPAHPAHANRDKPLTPPAQGVLGLLLAKSGLPPSRMPKTFAQAYELLDEEGKGLFGR
ncbi:alkaline phosphatase family protein [Microbacterium sp. NPDC057659]|uniref:alkaline phosphatase family protein n=1 Tax=Microbacterium sp. NPDC057659 TaxID=3346198 RepID=UPI00366D91B1